MGSAVAAQVEVGSGVLETQADAFEGGQIGVAYLPWIEKQWGKYNYACLT